MGKGWGTQSTAPCTTRTQSSRKRKPTCPPNLGALLQAGLMKEIWGPGTSCSLRPHLLPCHFIYTDVWGDPPELESLVQLSTLSLPLSPALGIPLSTVRSPSVSNTPCIPGELCSCNYSHIPCTFNHQDLPPRSQETTPEAKTQI